MKIALLLFVLLLAGCESAAVEEPVVEQDPMVQMPEMESDSELEDPQMDSTPDVSQEESEVETPSEEEAQPETSDDDEETEDESSESSESQEDSATEEPEDPATEETQTSDNTQPVFTAETLAYYDGREGRPAYVAVDGLVYDLSSSSRWRNGSHNGFQAGRDLTQAFAQQHGDFRLNQFPVVGTYVD